MKKGLIQVYTGDGRGKTTAATGQIIRAIGRGYRVMMVYWLKEEGSSGEMQILKKLGVETLFWGSQYGKKLMSSISIENKGTLREKSRRFLDQIKNQMKKGYDLLVMDEINVALNHGLVEEKSLLNFLEKKPSSLEIILTGRRMPQYILTVADLITEMRKIKHPYDWGTKMRKGIEY